MKIRILLVMACLLLVGAAAADFYPQSHGFFFGFSQLTVVNGATCSTSPTQSGYTINGPVTLTCPTTYAGSTNKGCALVLWYGYYDGGDAGAFHYQMSPGQSDTIGQGRTYELYPCADTQCSCEGEANVACGGGNCPDTMMQRTRTCQPAGCAWESTCVERAECQDDCTPRWQCADYGQCNEDGKQGRICYDEKVCGTSDGKPTEVRSCTPGGGDDSGQGFSWLPIIITVGLIIIGIGGGLVWAGFPGGIVGAGAGLVVGLIILAVVPASAAGLSNSDSPFDEIAPESDKYVMTCDMTLKEELIGSEVKFKSGPSCQLTTQRCGRSLLSITDWLFWYVPGSESGTVKMQVEGVIVDQKEYKVGGLSGGKSITLSGCVPEQFNTGQILVYDEEQNKINEKPFTAR